ncbi:MAG: 23S rRNA (adenine(2503)-C(2))-methyltransferase RlmN [Treponema sp.]|jgi:23S rRNA (adenine2503-C2)-methyltransferase|nr:23S rRNA (adenine(2503)-C(2))-methyltransferase RlmN [Treponema sp.]
MTPRELEALPCAGGEKKFRAAQIFSWIARGAVSFDEMDNLPLSLRKKLESAYRLRSVSVSETLRGADGTVKLRLGLDDGAAIEAVLLKARETGARGDEDGGRFTACLSTQAGCPAGCVFCKTGSLGFLRNLSAAEIVEQFLVLNSVSKSGVSHVVVMGMGEPLLNLEALGKALGIIIHPEGIGLSKRRITVSTSGIESGIYALAEKGPLTELAVSLTTAREDLRRRLMPFAGLAGLEGLKKALKAWQQNRGRRVTLETVLLGGINTTADDAEALVRFTRGLKTAINVIPWNPVEGLLFEGKALRAPERAEIDGFRARLEAAGLTVTRRYRRGQGVAGACGQLGVT